MNKSFLTILFIFITQNALSNQFGLIEFTDIQEKIYCESLCYQDNYFIKANKRIINTKTKFKLNTKDMVRNNSYYKDGEFVTKKITVKFKKAYKYNSKFYMENCSGIYNGSKFKSNIAVKYNNYIEFNRIVIKDKILIK